MTCMISAWAMASPTSGYIRLSFGTLVFIAALVIIARFQVFFSVAEHLTARAGKLGSAPVTPGGYTAMNSPVQAAFAAPAVGQRLRSGRANSNSAASQRRRL